MEDAYLATYKDERVLTLCLDSIFSNYDLAIASIYKHIGVEPVESVRACVNKQNPKYFVQSVGSFSHSTHISFSQEDREEVRSLITNYDTQLFQGSLGTSRIAKACASSKEIASTPRKAAMGLRDLWLDTFA